jgi:hypothetical protein
VRHPTITDADHRYYRRSMHVTETITTDAVQAEAEAEQTPEVLGEMAASAAALAEAAAQHALTAAQAAQEHLTRTYAYAARAEDANERDAALTAADAASAADAEANKARLALADVIVHVGFAEQHRNAVASAEHRGDDDLAAADGAVQRATVAKAAAAAASDEAQNAARWAGAEIDWLRYHLDDHCRHWRDRVEPLTDDELVAAAKEPPF